MKTASWFTVGAALGRIGISRGTPRNVFGGYRLFKALAPHGHMLRMERAEYEVEFQKILGALDPQQTWDRLHELAGDAEPVLLCFEKPPFTATNWCHRRMVAEWFEKTLGHEVPEYHPNIHGVLRKAAAREPDPEDVAAIETYVGKTCWHNRHRYEVLGVNPKVPDQALVRRDDGTHVTITVETLERYFSG